MIWVLEKSRFHISRIKYRQDSFPNALCMCLDKVLNWRSSPGNEQFHTLHRDNNRRFSYRDFISVENNMFQYVFWCTTNRVIRWSKTKYNLSWGRNIIAVNHINHCFLNFLYPSKYWELFGRESTRDFGINLR